MCFSILLNIHSSSRGGLLRFWVLVPRAALWRSATSLCPGLFCWTPSGRICGNRETSKLALRASENLPNCIRRRLLIRLQLVLPLFALGGRDGRRCGGGIPGGCWLGRLRLIRRQVFRLMVRRFGCVPFLGPRRAEGRRIRGRFRGLGHRRIGRHLLRNLTDGLDAGQRPRFRERGGVDVRPVRGGLSRRNLLDHRGGSRPVGSRSLGDARVFHLGFQLIKHRLGLG